MIFHQRADRIAMIVVATITLACLVLVLVLPSSALLSAGNTDMVSEFVSWRAYLADSLRHGHLPLWNPYTYGGQPFLGGFESAVFYPPNLLFLCLPLAPALNFSMLLHLVILGWGMERWATRRGINPWAAGLAGFVVPLSGAVFPHVYAGHLSNLCTMAWAPWIFLGLEAWVSQGERRGLFLAGAAICLQVLAGHVQYFFYTAVAAGLQALVISVAQPRARWRALPTVAGCYLAGAAMGAAQLLPGLAASTEGVRQQKLDYDFAAMFGFPPENFLTLLAPGFFGNLGQPTYWGRCYLWEMTLFIGTASLPLIALACCDNRRRRQAYIDLTVAGLLLLLASGVHTPLFGPLYDFAPGFGHFRSWSKFIFPATLFLMLAAAAGADFLLREKRPVPRVAWCSIVVGIAAGAAGLFLFIWPECIAGMFSLVASSRESYLPPSVFVDADFMRHAGTDAGGALVLGGLALAAAGAALLFRGKWPVLRWALPVLLVVEMIGFVAGQVTVSSLSDAMPDGLRQFVSAHPGDYRVIDLAHGNNGFLLGAGDLWGNNPSVLRRYAEFMTFTQGGDPDHAVQYLNFKKFDPLYAMLRLRYAFVPNAQGLQVMESPVPPLSRLLLVSDWKMPGGRDAIFSGMREQGFNPAKTVLLESKPEPAPQSGAVGSATLVAESPDELTVEADTDRPALLLITDLYTRDWRAEALPGSVQQTYHLMSADYVLRAVPLMAGHHHLRIVYAPPSFPIGIGLSMVAWALWLGLYIWLWRPISQPVSPERDSGATSSSPRAAKRRRR
jgi:hypothetical protein